MNKKGFTLIEVLGVIVLLGVIAAITVPISTGIIKNSKEKAYKEQINVLVKAAKEWGIDNDKILSETDDTFVTSSDLIQGGYIKNDVLIDPRNNTEIKGCIKINYTNQYNQYEFSYQETGCPSPIYEVVIRDFPELEIGTNGCKTLDTNKNYTYMGGCYLKGAQTKNYLWYSGFVWRIMGINADKTIRLITEENVTVFSYNVANNTNYEGSHVDSWLNEYFYNNLKGKDIIVSNDFCQGAAKMSEPSRMDCTGGTTLNRKIGLLSMDEYNLSSASSSYLINFQHFWTMSPYISPNNWFVSCGGDVGPNDVSSPLGVRPVINVNSTSTIIKGNGTLSSTWTKEASPYILNENKSTSITRLLKDKVTSGEYVKFANKTYRVVSVDSSGNTKLILDGYYQETAGTNYKMAYGSNNTFTTSSGIGQNLNVDVLDWLIPTSDTNNRNKLVTNYTWYQNSFAGGDSYTVSLNETTPTRSIEATVGLIRMGEMLSGQSYTILTKNETVASSNSNASVYWTMTPYTNSSNVWYVNNVGSAANYFMSSSYGVRPVIVINSNVNITKGNGTPSSPYEI